MSRTRPEFVIAGGGTSGHVLPALAIAEAIVARGHPSSSIAFVGTRRGIEARLVPAAGFSLVRLPGRGIARKVTLRNVGAIGGLALAFCRSLSLLLRWRPRVVVSVGGFGAVACSLAAFVLRVPIVVVNVDSVPGAANRLVGRVAAASAVAFADTALPRAVVTGAPVRAEVVAFERNDDSRAKARAELAIAPDHAVVCVVGGSLGARRLNETALTLAKQLAGRDDITLYHVSGERELAMYSARRDALGLIEAPLDYRLVGYEDRLPALFSAADLAICRAGASTVAELCVIGTPSVLIPLPGAPSDHQSANARRLAQAGAALVVEDDEKTAARVTALCVELIVDEPRRQQMAKAARSLGRPDGAALIATLVDEVGDRRRHRLAEPGVGSVRNPAEET